MIKDITILVGDVEKHLRFNNFAHVELSKALFENGHLVIGPEELIDKLSEMAKANVMLLAKALIYAGMIGYDYEVGFKATVTQEEVGKIVADINDVELEKVWNTFLSAMGFDIASLIADRYKHMRTEEIATVKKKI